MQILYQIDITKDDLAPSIQDFWTGRENQTESEVKDFTQKLVTGLMAHKQEIDAIIREAAQNWQLERMAVVDRNILRLATYELLYCPDIPPKVSINEAIDIAKKFGDQDSGKFVNGILDKINKTKRADAEKG